MANKRKTVLAGLNALQGESLQDEPCPMGDKPLDLIGAGILTWISVIPSQKAWFFQQSRKDSLCQ